MKLDRKKIDQAIKSGKLIPIEKIYKKFNKEDWEDIRKESLNIENSIEIRKIRLEKKLTQKELAEKIGTKREFVSRVENGHQNITFKTMLKIANALGKNLKISFE